VGGGGVAEFIYGQLHVKVGKTWTDRAKHVQIGPEEQ